MLQNIDDNQFTFDSIENYLHEVLRDNSEYLMLQVALNEMKAECLKHKDFNYRKLLDRIKAKNIAYMSRPVSFIRKCLLVDISNGIFDDKGAGSLDKCIFTIIDLASEMRDKGFFINQLDEVRIEHYYLYINQHNLLSAKQLYDWTQKTLKYLSDNNLGTTHEFLKMFYNTRLMRSLGLPYKQLDAECDALVNEWKELLESVGIGVEK